MLSEQFEITDRHALHRRCLEEDICPRGCGPLRRVNAEERKCDVCGFRHVACKVKGPKE